MEPMATGEFMASLVVRISVRHHTPPMPRTRVLACTLVLLFGLGTVASAAKKDAAPAEPKTDDTAADISAYKSKLVVLHDGKSHYIAVVPFEVSDAHLFYGDGKKFFAQLTIS